MPSDDYEPEILPTDYARLARLSLAQANATLHGPTARVLRRMAEEYSAKAKAARRAGGPGPLAKAKSADE